MSKTAFQLNRREAVRLDRALRDSIAIEKNSNACKIDVTIKVEIRFQINHSSHTFKVLLTNLDNKLSILTIPSRRTQPYNILRKKLIKPFKPCLKMPRIIYHAHHLNH